MSRADYIEREAVNDLIKAECSPKVAAYLIDAVAAAPTIDAVPVVRCRECYYWESGENSCEKWEYCNFHRIGIGPNDFCSYGERKEEEQDNE